MKKTNWTACGVDYIVISGEGVKGGVSKGEGEQD